MNFNNRVLSALLGLGLLALPALAVAGHDDNIRSKPGAHINSRQKLTSGAQHDRDFRRGQVVTPRLRHERLAAPPSFYRGPNPDSRLTRRDHDHDWNRVRNWHRDRDWGRYDNRHGNDDYCDIGRPGLGVVQYRQRLISARNVAEARYLAALRSGNTYESRRLLSAIHHLNDRIEYLDRQFARGIRRFDYNGNFPVATGYGLYGSSYDSGRYVNNLLGALQSFGPVYGLR
jgi:hypothetical protein